VQKQGRIVLGWVIALVMAAAGVGGLRATAQTGASMALSSTQWNAFIADVTVRAGRLTADGTPVAVPTAPLQYRWERSQSGAGWKTVMAFADRKLTVGPAGARQTIDNPYAIARIEDDEDGSPLRIFGRDGRRVHAASVDRMRQLTESGLRQLGSAAAAAPGFEPGAKRPDLPLPRRFVGSAERGWLAAFVATPQERSARRARLQRQFVRRGQVRGLDRFISNDGSKLLEVLADAESAVPLEVNTLRDGKLLSHSTIAYQPAADGSLVRRAVHAEQILSDVTGERSIIDTEYTSVRVERRW